MQYMSMSPISLLLSDKQGKAPKSTTHLDGADVQEEAERSRRIKLVEKLRLHTVTKHPRTQKELALTVILHQINCSYEVNILLQKNIGMVGVRLKRSLSVGERVVESATNLRNYVVLEIWQMFWIYVYPVASQLFILGLITLRMGSELALEVLEWRPVPDRAALKDISATAQQVDIRLQQFCYWPVQYLTLRRRRRDWESITTSQPEYIRFYNSLWLVANDVIIGIAIGSYIIENADFVARQVDIMVDSWSIQGLQRMISWLMGWPAGLKLNNELAAFLGDLFLWVIEYWAGASLPISLTSDLITLLTLHIYSFYIASARIYNWQLSILASLFHLFRGKKRNVLRNRIDSCDYDLDQLLLGTILFTLLVFLLPTVAVFYIGFAGARMGILAVKGVGDVSLAVLNHFPLFALMLRIKDSRRLPGGIRFELQDTPVASLSSKNLPTSTHVRQAPTSYIKLKSVPLPLSQTFAQYAQLGARIRKHYLLPAVFLCLVTGRFVPPIHRRNLYSLQYSMLPARRVGVGELWRMLVGEEGAANGRVSGPAAKKAGKGKGSGGMWWSK
ncbi:pig-Q [Elasticomyces elasticus]|nr:pig-Q [Elasticomyces elasticus]